jgi:hypothetical protein
MKHLVDELSNGNNLTWPIVYVMASLWYAQTQLRDVPADRVKFNECLSSWTAHHQQRLNAGRTKQEKDYHGYILNKHLNRDTPFIPYDELITSLMEHYAIYWERYPRRHAEPLKIEEMTEDSATSMTL